MAVLTLFFVLFLFKISRTLQLCQDSCSPIGPEVRFPFALDGDGCSSYPGFNLSCSVTGHTILHLPHSGNFIVQFIDYQTQEISIRDPENCFAKRLLHNFSLSGTPFYTQSYRTFSFLNCSLNFSDSVSLPPFSRSIPCLSSDNFTVVAVPTGFDGYLQSIMSCTVKAEMVNVPVYWPRYPEGYSSLIWAEPDCDECEQSGGTCGFKDSANLDVGCFNLPSNTHRLPRSAKYGIIIGVGIPGLLCIIGLGCYLCGRVRSYSRSHHSNAEVTTTFAHPPSIAIGGLDGPTIESYPKTLLGESRRLPKPNDNTCPICLCEYQAKETLRTIPECNHYFHADCIDEWLKLNGTCPLCRNSPELSSTATTPSSLLCASPSSSSASSSLSSV